MSDAKRQTWFAELANPDVPLSKLGKSVPHGAKGHDLLDLLHTNNVAIPRAVWFLRVFGANETVSPDAVSLNCVMYMINDKRLA
jgi:mediator of RNA polymerase II transcription subunit 12